uniref:Uncharacterized protein n=1 Tax=Rhizophora mucronata TaxID=61149 RepID=A0A2P2NEN2_RHIMU
MLVSDHIPALGRSIPEEPIIPIPPGAIPRPKNAGLT